MLGLDAALHFALRLAFTFFAHLGHVAVGNAQDLANSASTSGQLGRFDLHDHVELDGLASQVLGVVVSREGRHVEGLDLAGLEAQRRFRNP